MLLWHDSLDYRSAVFGAARYLTFSGFLINGEHPQSGRRSLATLTGSTSTLTYQAQSAGETCIVGFLFWASIHPGAYPVFSVRTIGGSIQVRVNAVNRGGKTAFRFFRGNQERFLIESSPIDVSTPTYLEFVVKVGGSGSVALRVNGVEDVRAENVNTEFIPSVGWGQVMISPAASGLGSFCRIADLYIADATGSSFNKPLGPVIGSKLFPGASVDEPSSFSPMPGGKYRLVVMAGQSNNNGRAVLDVDALGSFRSPNPKLLIWENHLGATTWSPVEAGVNTYGFFLPIPRPAYYGPEMRFAERLAQLYEGAGETAVPNVRLLKLAQDASLIPPFPGNPTFSWAPSQAGSLFHLSVAEVNAAVATLGGWGNIEHIDWFWYQGETEAITHEGPPIYAALNTDLFNQLAASFPVPVNFTRVRIHPKTGLPFVFKHELRLAQTNPMIPGIMVNVDEYPLQEDGIHLTPRGYNALGDIYFEVWKKNQLMAEAVKDYYYVTAPDSEFVSGASAKSWQVIKVPELQVNLAHAPAVSVSHRLHAECVSASTLRLKVGDLQLPDIPMSVSTQWTPYRSAVSGFFFPEAIADGRLVYSVP